MIKYISLVIRGERAVAGQENRGKFAPICRKKNIFNGLDNWRYLP